MRPAGVKNIIEINLQVQLEACLGAVTMPSLWQLAGG
jgi:hypothetical protein